MAPRLARTQPPDRCPDHSPYRCSRYPDHCPVRTVPAAVVVLRLLGVRLVGPRLVGLQHPGLPEGLLQAPRRLVQPRFAGTKLRAHTDRQTDRQTDTHTHTHKVGFKLAGILPAQKTRMRTRSSAADLSRHRQVTMHLTQVIDLMDRTCVICYT